MGTRMAKPLTTNHNRCPVGTCCGGSSSAHWQCSSPFQRPHMQLTVAHCVPTRPMWPTTVVALHKLSTQGLPSSCAAYVLLMARTNAAAFPQMRGRSHLPQRPPRRQGRSARRGQARQSLRRHDPQPPSLPLHDPQLPSLLPHGPRSQNHPHPGPQLPSCLRHSPQLPSRLRHGLQLLSRPHHDPQLPSLLPRAPQPRIHPYPGPQVPNRPHPGRRLPSRPRHGP